MLFFIILRLTMLVSMNINMFLCYSIFLNAQLKMIITAKTQSQLNDNITGNLFSVLKSSHVQEVFMEIKH